MRVAGLFNRAVKAMGDKKLVEGMAKEATELRKVLAAKLISVRLHTTPADMLGTLTLAPTAELCVCPQPSPLNVRN